MAVDRSGGGRPHQTGRPPVGAKLAALIGQMARDKPGLGVQADPGRAARRWVPDRASPVRRVLPGLRIPPARQRSRTTWQQFLRTQKEAEAGDCQLSGSVSRGHSREPERPVCR